MAKLVQRVALGAAPSKRELVRASDNSVAHGIFGGKTLLDVAREYDLGDEDVVFGFNTNPNTGDEIRVLLVGIGDKEYSIPISRGAGDIGKLDNCLNWKFRTGFLSVKENGVPKTDENGAVVLDKMKPYMSFGKPDGLTIERREAAFSPIEETMPLADAAK